MKELTIEEKAKHYDEAIERGKQILNTPYTAHWDIMKEVAEHLLPSLKESEDERIRKALIHLINEQDGFLTAINGISVKDVLAWLEKQGNANKEYWRGYREGKQEILDKYAELKKQGEQKPIDTVEPKFREGDMIIHKELGGDYIHSPHKIIQVDMLDKKYRLEGGLVAHFGEQDDYELVEQKPAWSEEDEVKINRIVACLENLNVADNDILLKDVDWLKSLKDRFVPQSKQEWSEEDEDMLYKAIAVINRLCAEGKEYVWSIKTLKKLFYWLKSLRPQNRWKPSEEQMHYLHWIANVKLGDSVVEQEVSKHLNELYEDLKKLREE